MGKFKINLIPVVFMLIALTFCPGNTKNNNGHEPTPSPEFQCPPNSEDTFHRHPNDCSAYFHCTNGLAWMERCPAGLHFNTETLICDWPNNVNCGNSDMEYNVAVTPVPDPDYNCTSNGVFPHLTYCEKYYECWANEATLHTCAELMLFDLRYMGCNYAELTGCQDRIRPPGVPGTQTPEEPTTTRPSTTFNPNVTTTTSEPDPGYNCTENGAFPHAKYCEWYYDCWQGADVLMLCRENWLFDLRYDGCNYPEYVDCGDRIRPPDAPGTLTPPPPTGPTTTRPPGSFECPAFEGLFPDPRNCAAFYNCANWVPVHYTCPYPLLYNPNIKACDHPGAVDCGDRPRP